MPVKRKSVAMENDGEFSSFLREHKLEMRESHFHVQSSARFKFEAKAAAGGIDCESFAQEFESFIEEPKELRRCLAPMIEEKAISTPDGKKMIQSDSLIKVLLGLGSIQSNIIQLLIEKIPFCAEEESEGNNSGRQPLTSLILQHLRWVDFVIDPNAMIQSLLQCLEAAELNLQKDIISIIPEIVDDASLSIVVSTLRQLMEQDTKMTVPVLDALGNLNLDTEQLLPICNSALATIGSTAVENLPIVIRFLLQSTGKEGLTKMIQDLRNNLDLASSSTISDMRDKEPLILEALTSGAQFRQDITKAFLKVIEISANGMILDLWFIFIVHSSSHLRGKVNSLLRKKVNQRVFDCALLNSSIIGHTAALQPHFDNMLAIANYSLRNPSKLMQSFGHELYLTMFDNFSEAYQCQEIVSVLITHSGASDSSEVTCALNVLQSMCKTPARASKLAVYISFIKGILDFVESLRDSHVRQVFGILRSLSSQRQHDDELQILLRKYVSHNRPRYKKIGVIGIVSGMKATPGSSNRSKRDYVKEAEQACHLIDESCSGMPILKAFFYDELASSLSESQPKSKALQWLNDNLWDTLEDNFFLGLSELQPTKLSALGKKFGLPCRLDLHIDDSEANVCLDLLSALTHADSLVRDTVIWLCPLFRALVKSEMILKDSFAQLGSSLDCPLLMFEEEESFESLSDVGKDKICASLYFSISWLRQVINAFITEDSDEIRQNLCQRLLQSMALQRKLLKYVQKSPKCATAILMTLGSVTKTPVLTLEAEEDSDCVDDEDSDSFQAMTTALFDSSDEENNNEKEKACASRSQNPKLSQRKPKGKSKKRKKISGKQAKLQKQKKHKNALQDLRDTLLSHLRPLEAPVAQLLSFVVTDPDGEKYSFKPSEIVPVVVMDMRSKLKTAIRRNSVFMTRFHKSGKDDFCAPQIQSYEVPELLKLYIKVAIPHFRKLMTYQMTAHVKDVDDNIDISETVGPQAVMSLLVHFVQDVMDCKYLRQDKALLHAFFEALNTEDELASAASKNNMTIEKHCAQFFEFMQDITGAVSSLEISMQLVMLLRTTVIIQRENSTSDKSLAIICKQLSGLGEKLIQKDWSKGDSKFAYKKSNLGVLLDVHLQFSPQPSVAIQRLLEVLEEFLTENGKDTVVPSFPTLNQKSFPLYFDSSMAALVKAFKGLNFKDSSTRGIFEEVDKCVSAFHVLSWMTKVNHTKKVMNVFLKKGKLFVDSFIKQIKFFESHFQKLEQETRAILKAVQVGTRQMNQLCAHGKVVKDTNMARIVPGIKRTLEEFILRVKIILQANDRVDLFWVGNLRHRTISGAIVEEEKEEDDSTDDEEVSAEEGSEGGEEESNAEDQQDNEEEEEDSEVEL